MSDKHVDASSGQVELDGFIGEWTVNDGRMKLTCLTAGGERQRNLVWRAAIPDRYQED